MAGFTWTKLLPGPACLKKGEIPGPSRESPGAGVPWTSFIWWSIPVGITQAHPYIFFMELRLPPTLCMGGGILGGGTLHHSKPIEVIPIIVD